MNPEDAGEDRDAVANDIEEIIESDGEDEGHPQGFPYDTQWEVEDAQDIQPGEEFVDLPPFVNAHNDRNGHYNRNYVGGLHPVTELDYFEIFFTRETMQRFVDNTNIYRKRFVKGWIPKGDITRAKETNINEMMALFAIIFYSGIVRYPNRNDMFDPSNKGM